METNRKFAPLFLEWGESFDELTDEELGLFTRMLIKYVQYDEEPVFEDPMLRLWWKAYRAQIQQLTKQIKGGQ